jgi:hypothetical protein
MNQAGHDSRGFRTMLVSKLLTMIQTIPATRMKHTRTQLVLGLLIAVCPMIAAEPDLSKLPPPSAKKGLTYAKDIRPILEASCFRCHSDQQQKCDLRLDSLEAILKGSEHGKVIAPGKSKASLLVVAVSQLDEEKAMPPKRKPGQPGRGGQPGGPPPSGPGGAGNRPPGGPGGPGGFGPPPKPLTAEQVGLVRAWIDQGAK